MLISADPLRIGLSAAQQPGETPADQLTVERIYSAPSLSGRILRDTVWSPDGKLLTYLDDDGGRPEIWAVDATTGRRHVLVDAEHLRDVLLPPESRGQQTGLGRLSPTRYLWSPDSQALVFISARELFWYDLKSQSAKKLVGEMKGQESAGEDADIDDAKISPDSHWVSFLRNHDLWVASVAGGEPRQLTKGGSEELHDGELDWVYPEELDLETAYWWAPDSSKIAFLQLDEHAVQKYPLVNELPVCGFRDGRTVSGCGLAKSRGARGRGGDTGWGCPMDGYGQRPIRAAGASGVAAGFTARGYRAAQSRAEPSGAAFRGGVGRKMPDGADRAGQVLDQFE